MTCDVIDVCRSFAAQDVLVPWHLADHHNQPQDNRRGKRDPDANAADTAEEGGGSGGGGDCGRGEAAADDLEPGQPKAEEAAEACTGGSSTSQPTAKATSAEGGGDDGGGGGAGGVSSTPTPSAPRHGVRIEAGATPGGGGSVVYQRYCHVYTEGELEGLVERVDGLRLVDSYYDRSNWCVVAEREV